VKMLERFLSIVTIALFLNMLLLIPRYGQTIAIVGAFFMGRAFGWRPISFGQLQSANADHVNPRETDERSAKTK